MEYNPKYTLIYNKSLSGPQWNTIKGRKKPKIEIDERDFICVDKHKNNFINNFGESKCLVNMNKYTQRGNFIDLKDIRLRNDKPFIKEKKFHKKKTKTKLIKYLKNYLKEDNKIISNNQKPILLKKNKK
jgi:hypothetical protein